MRIISEGVRCIPAFVRQNERIVLASTTQYTVNVHGLIIHNTRHSPGRVHDFKVYKTKHPTFPMNLPSRDGSAREGKRANLRSYGDRGYQGAQKADPDVEVVLPIRCKPGKKLSPEEREINRLQSRDMIRN